MSRLVDVGPTVGLALITITSLAAWYTWTLVYRLFFSPMSKLPGPWMTRISSVPEVNALKEQRRTQWVNNLFAQNPGAIAVRTSPSSVSFNDPTAVKAIYGTYPLHAPKTQISSSD